MKLSNFLSGVMSILCGFAVVAATENHVNIALVLFIGGMFCGMESVLVILRQNKKEKV